MPRAYINLPLYFRGSNKYASKRITIFSIIILAFLIWSSYNSLIKIGKIENVF